MKVFTAGETSSERNTGATFSRLRKSRSGEAQECKAEALGSLVLVVPLILLTR
jgi:hypothetical protein